MERGEERDMGDSGMRGDRDGLRDSWDERKRERGSGREMGRKR